MSNQSIRVTRQALVTATQALATYKWRRKGDSKAKLVRQLSILSAWLHIQLYVAGITNTTPAAKHYTLASLDSALLRQQAS